MRGLGLVSMLRQQQRDLSQMAIRAFASAADVALATESPFLRFSNPYPTAIDHTPLLSTIPETQVSRSGSACQSGGMGHSRGAAAAVRAQGGGCNGGQVLLRGDVRGWGRGGDCDAPTGRAPVCR